MLTQEDINRLEQPMLRENNLFFLLIDTNIKGVATIKTCCLTMLTLWAETQGLIAEMPG